MGLVLFWIGAPGGKPSVVVVIVWVGREVGSRVVEGVNRPSRTSSQGRTDRGAAGEGDERLGCRHGPSNERRVMPSTPGNHQDAGVRVRGGAETLPALILAAHGTHVFLLIVTTGPAP
jgi:hypothetical protein